MPRHRERPHREGRTGRHLWLYLAVVAGVLVVVVLLLALRIGQAGWPEWLVTARGQVIGLIGLALLAALCALPILIEASSRPRRLSGPGHNPEQGPGNK